MAKKTGNNKQAERTQQRPRVWNLILYRDSDTYDFDDVLFNITDKAEKYYIIEHGAEEETKKNHVHCVIRLKDGKTQSAVSKFFGVQENYFEATQDICSSVRYLIHADNPTKKQYSIDDVITNDKDGLKKYLSNKNSEGLIVLEMLNKLDSGFSFRRCLQWACENNYYSEFRRNFGILHTIIEDERK